MRIREAGTLKLGANLSNSEASDARGDNEDAGEAVTAVDEEEEVDVEQNPRRKGYRKRPIVDFGVTTR